MTRKRSPHASHGKLLRAKWPSPWMVRIWTRLTVREGVEVRYRLYPFKDSKDFESRMAFFHKGRLVGDRKVGDIHREGD